MGAQVRGAVYKRQRCTFIVFTLGSSQVCVRAHIGTAENSSREQFTVNPEWVFLLSEQVAIDSVHVCVHEPFSLPEKGELFSSICHTFDAD